MLCDIAFGWSEPHQVERPRRKYNKKRMWVRKLYQQRQNVGAYEAVVRPMAGFDSTLYRNYMRMTLAQFEMLLGLVGPYITKEAWRRKPISAGERLAITIR